METSSSSLTWKKVWTWVCALYALSVFGYFVRAADTLGGLRFENIWQIFALLMLPAVLMLPFLAIGFVYLAFKKFDVSKGQAVITILMVLCALFLAAQIFSGRPL